MVPLKVIKMDDGSWVLDVRSTETAKIYFPKWRSEYASVDDMPECVRDKVALLGHAPAEGDPPISYKTIGHRYSNSIFWVYLTQEEAHKVTSVTL